MSKRTAQTIEQTNSLKTKAPSATSKRGKHPNSRANLRPYPKGVSGNPGGRPKDVAGRIAQAIFEQNEEAIYERMAKEIFKGSAYAFDVLANRAYGKLKQPLEHSGEVSITDILREGRERVNKLRDGDSSDSTNR